MRFVRATLAVLLLALFSVAAAESREATMSQPPLAKPRSAATAEGSVARLQGHRAPRYARKEVRVVNQNISGGDRGHGDYAALDAVNQQIDEYSPDVVVVVEICFGQVEAFRADHQGWETYFTVLRNDDETKCQGVDANGEPNPVTPDSTAALQGEMVASPHPLSDVTRIELPNDPPGVPAAAVARSFHLTCADVDMPGPPVADALRACATHLRSGHGDGDGNAAEIEQAHDQVRAAQVATIRSELHARVLGGQRVVVAGDFNARPADAVLDGMYRLPLDGAASPESGLGDFAESDQTDKRWFCQTGQVAECPPDKPNECDPVMRGACRSGEGTVLGAESVGQTESDAVKRYDQIFFSWPGTRELDGTAGTNNDSGHRLIWGRASMRLATRHDLGRPNSRVSSIQKSRLKRGKDAQRRGAKVSIRFHATDPGGSGVERYMCRLDNGRYRKCKSPRRYRGVRRGPHTFRVYAVDGDGNRERKPAVRRFVV